MPQRYKVRLGDGTFVSVDMDGLRAWVHDPRAVAQAVGSQQWRPIQEMITEEESAARLLRALIPPQPKATPPPPEAPPREPDPSPPFAEPPSYSAPPDAAPSYSAPSYSPPAFGQPLAFGEPAFGEPAFGEPAPPSEPAPFEAPPAYGEPAVREPDAPRESVQTLADETSSIGATSGSDTAQPPIRMKPLEDEPEFRSAWDEREEGHESEAEPRNELDGPLLTVLAPLGTFLSRVLTPLSSLVQRWTQREARAESSFPSLSEPSFSEPSALPEVAKGPSLGERLSEAWSGLRARLRRPEPAPEPEPEPEPAPEETEPAPQIPLLSRVPTPPRTVAPREREPVPSAARVSVAPQRAPVAPPPPLSSIPVLPLAESVRPREAEDVYEEEEPSQLFGPVWFWTKRLVVLGGLAALGSAAYRERDLWFPKAGEVGQTMFTAIDRTARSRQRAEQQQRALGEATAKLPHLTPQTILLLFGQSPTGLLDPPEAFQLAREAAERGQGKLPPAEAQELRVLEHDLAATLRPPERWRLEEYDQARTRRVIFPFENPYAMDLVAKGARALPAERLERLRALTQQAVAAGIAVPAAEPKDAAAR